MEMDAVELGHDKEYTQDTSADQLLSSASPGMNDIFGEPQVAPRIGEEYQVKIPPLTSEPERLQLLQSPICAESMVDVDCSIQIGLPIPIMWVHDVIVHIKHKSLEFLGNTTGSSNSGSSKQNQINSKSSTRSQNGADSSNRNAAISVDSVPKAEVLNDASDHGKSLSGSPIHGNTMVCDQMDVGLSSPNQNKSNLVKNNAENYNPVPGSLGDSWSDIEQESFLLGLYIFGKNLAQVKRFMESKEMGDVLSFYYGKFYRSDGHHRWSECWKIRSRRSIHGQRIFTGWRQQELLSRLLPHISKECGNTLLEVSRTFNEGKVSLEEYVSTLKTKVGLSILVEAVGIGKGKQDLTGIVMEPVKTNQLISSRSEIPIGKACSSLTSGDIIKFLTGDFRLSKARSNDLFWEAVWPRLLARGWHSEQPKNQGYVGSKHPLVFLVPGIKKFSRRKLVKGNDYFDSVSDVLNKVSTDPRLLELEVEAVNGSRPKEEYAWDMDAKMDRTDPSDHQRPCYLRPRLPNCNSDLMKFTVVDTSLVHEDGPCKVRELRTLPIDSPHNDSPVRLSKETEDDSSQEQEDEPDAAGPLLNNEEEFYPAVSDDNKLGNDMKCILDSRVHSDQYDYALTLSKRMLGDGTDSANLQTDNHKDEYPDMLDDKQTEKNIKCRFSSMIKSVRPNYLSPVVKRRRLNACSKAECSRCPDVFPGGPVLTEKEPLSQTNSPEESDIMVPETGPCQLKTSTSGSDKTSREESSDCILGENCFAVSSVSETALSQEKPQPRALIDLNLPHDPPDFEAAEPFISEMADSQDNSTTKEACFLLETEPQPEESISPKTSNGTTEEPARRQSTRNRPLTTRALEALECGFLNTKRRGMGKKDLLHENAVPRSSRRRVWRKFGVSSPVATSSSGNVGNSTMDCKVNGVDEECSSNANVASKSQIFSERRGSQDILGILKTSYEPEILTGKDNRPG